jgi:hypothetical protein
MFTREVKKSMSSSILTSPHHEACETLQTKIKLLRAEKRRLERENARLRDELTAAQAIDARTACPCCHRPAAYLKVLRVVFYCCGCGFWPGGKLTHFIDIAAKTEAMLGFEKSTDTATVTVN